MQANTIRVSFWLKNTSDTDEANPWIITQFLKPESAPLSSELFASEFQLSPPAGLYALWHNAVGTTAGTGGFRAALPSAVGWYYTEISARLALSSGDADHVATFTPPSVLAGALAGTVAPQPLALIAQKQTTTGSRRQWGRNYLPTIASYIDTDGRIATSSAAGVVTALNAVWASSWVRHATYARVVQNGDGVSRNIGTTGLGTYVGVQRRRLR